MVINKQLTNIYSITVPESFFVTLHPHCKELAEESNFQSGQRSVGCHCIEDNLKCREILHFLTLNGRFAVNGILNKLLHDTIRSFPMKSTTDFDAMMNEMLHPIFTDEFSQKLQFLKNKSINIHNDISKIKTEVDCWSYGPDCIVAIDRLNDTIQKLYRIFVVLNKEYENKSSFNRNDVKRNLGTLLTNLNFLLDSSDDSKYDGSSVTVPASSSHGKKHKHSLQLQKDLKMLLGNILPSDEITLTNMISFLGYADIMEHEPLDVMDCDTSNSLQPKHCQENNVSHLSHSSLKNVELLQLQGLRSLSEITSECDFHQYHRIWNEFYKNLLFRPMILLRNRTSGKIFQKNMTMCKLN